MLLLIWENVKKLKQRRSNDAKSLLLYLLLLFKSNMLRYFVICYILENVTCYSYKLL